METCKLRMSQIVQPAQFGHRTEDATTASISTEKGVALVKKELS